MRRAKVLIKEINNYFDNHSQRYSLYVAVKNHPAKINVLLNQTQGGTVTYNNSYHENVLGKVLNKLENINTEAQKYFNKWSKDKDLVEITNAERDRVVVNIINLKSYFLLLSNFSNMF